MAPFIRDFVSFTSTVIVLQLFQYRLKRNFCQVCVIFVWNYIFVFLFLLWFNVPVNNFSVMLRWSHLFLGITSTFGE